MNYSKLTPEMVEGIKKDYIKGNTQKTIIYKYKIATATMYKICEGLKPKRKGKNIYEKVLFDLLNFRVFDSDFTNSKFRDTDSDF